jgi:hypothetical protein
VVWVHRDVEMGAKCTRCTRCLAYFGSGIYGCTISPSMSEKTSGVPSVRTKGGQHDGKLDEPCLCDAAAPARSRSQNPRCDGVTGL